MDQIEIWHHWNGGKHLRLDAKMASKIFFQLMRGIQFDKCKQRQRGKYDKLLAVSNMTENQISGHSINKKKWVVKLIGNSPRVNTWTRMSPTRANLSSYSGRGNMLTHQLYNLLYSTSENVLKLQSIHMKDAPFRPIAKVSGRLAGNKEHHVVNSMDKNNEAWKCRPLDEQCRIMYRLWSPASQ